MIIGDFHTHSRFSDGKATIIDNYNSAVAKGLKQFGCTEHGLSHIGFGLREWNIPRIRGIVDKLNSEGKLQVLMGVEANIYTSYGDIDVPTRLAKEFDFVIAGFHKASFNPLIGDYFKYNLLGQLGKKNFSKTQIDRFTRTFVTAIRSGKANIISHLFYGLPVDAKTVGKVAGDYGIYLELNGKKVSIPDDDLLTLVDNPYVKFIVNSDAHNPERVGNFSVPMGVVERLNIDKNRIVNWNNLVKFN